MSIPSTTKSGGAGGSASAQPAAGLYKSPVRRSVIAAGGRRGDLAAIHIAKAALGLDDDEYRDLMATVCGGIRSAADLDFTGRKAFLAHLQACMKSHGLRSEHTIKAALTPKQRQMWALWMQLADAGIVRERSMPALAAWSARQTGVQRVEWLNAQQQDLVIASLRRWFKERG